MRLKIVGLWSPDLAPPESGAPTDTRDFSVFVQVAISQWLHRGHEVFQFFACSPNPSKTEYQPALEFVEFDWDAIRKRITKLLS
jgi:hypothetical protein